MNSLIWMKNKASYLEMNTLEETEDISVVMNNL